jgi:hypothetical protein
MAKPDLTYACHDGIWTRFYPETPRGEDAYAVMAATVADGVVAFLPGQVPGVLAQLRAAGLSVSKAAPVKPLTKADWDEIDAMIAELDALAGA